MRSWTAIIVFVTGGWALGCAGDDAGASGGTSDEGSTTTGVTTTSATTTSSTGSGTDTGSTSAEASTGSQGTSGNPVPTAPPQLGVQLDRVGRPLVSTALLERWQVADAAHDAAVDAYNADATPAGWSDAHWSQLHLAMGVFDSLDLQAGDSPQYDGDSPPPCDMTAVRDCYAFAARLFANDWLLVRAESSQAADFLGIEEELLGVSSTSDSRGGRRPVDDVADQLYTFLSNTNLTDSVDAPQSAQVDEFPYLGPAN